MNTVAIAIFVAIFAAAVVLVVTNLGGRGSQKKKSKKLASGDQKSGDGDTQWRAVRIAPGLISCKAVAEHANEVFLASSAPRLPLAECSEKECRCKYIHLDDRRSGGDRRIELGELGAFLPTNQIERRTNNGRRVADLAV